MSTRRSSCLHQLSYLDRRTSTARKLGNLLFPFYSFSFSFLFPLSVYELLSSTNSFSSFFLFFPFCFSLFLFLISFFPFSLYELFFLSFCFSFPFFFFLFVFLFSSTNTFSFSFSLPYFSSHFPTISFSLLPLLLIFFFWGFSPTFLRSH